SDTNGTDSSHDSGGDDVGGAGSPGAPDRPRRSAARRLAGAGSPDTADLLSAEPASGDLAEPRAPGSPDRARRTAPWRVGGPGRSPPADLPPAGSPSGSQRSGLPDASDRAGRGRRRSASGDLAEPGPAHASHRTGWSASGRWLGTARNGARAAHLGWRIRRRLAPRLRLGRGSGRWGPASRR